MVVEDGGSAPVKKRIYISFAGNSKQLVAWYAGASDESILQSIGKALRLNEGTKFIVIDPSDDSVLAVSDSMPNGLNVEVQIVGTLVKDEVAAATAASSNGEGNFFRDDKIGGPQMGGATVGENEFRGQLIKFERINAHLANERTWLAWVRTALSILTLALAVISLADDLGSFAQHLAGVLGIGFVSCTLFTYFTGWQRYDRIKHVLAWRHDQIKQSFGRFSLTYQAIFLALTIVLAAPLYIYTAFES